MTAPQASSRLELLQARFQQKQLQEKEQKLLQLYDQQQQRAYQVVQRGSANSNGSNYGSSVSQHSVTKTSTSNHTTSTSQGGKVRQMFDERRQTTVKGIDRSYPLEPLENKPRKQANGNGPQRNGNSTVNRHSMTVKRVARADVNSNLNGGKPIVSYHEEITRESFGPSGHQQQPDDDEFGNENHVAQYANGNHRDEIHIEEVLDEDTIERNRMMAKLHLMEYDETLKHHIKNDLESEEFPEDFMVDVPDKLPKQSVSKKLSQAEARLERFRNANAKRSNNAAKNISTTSVPKKRSDPIFPAKSTSSRSKTDMGSSVRKSSVNNNETRKASRTSENVRGSLLSSGSHRTVRKSNYSPEFYCKESEKSVTTYAIDPKAAGKSSPDFLKEKRSRSESPEFYCKASEKLATAYATDTEATGKSSPDFLKEKRSRNGSPEFYCKESKKSATTYAIDSVGVGRSSPDFLEEERSRSGSPKFFCKESKKSTTTYAIDSKVTGRSSPDFSKERSGSGSPKFFCNESEKSATTYAIDSKTNKKLTTDLSKNLNRSVIKIEPDSEYIKRRSTKTSVIGDDTVDRYAKSTELDKIRRIFSSSDNVTDYTTIHSTIDDKIDSRPVRETTNVFKRLSRGRGASPYYLHQEYKKSAPITAINIKNRDFVSKSPNTMEKIPKNHEGSSLHRIKYSNSRSTTAKSPDFAKASLRKSNTSPQFSSDRSATIMFVTPETITKTRTGYAKNGKKERSLTSSVRKTDMNIANRIFNSNKKISTEDVDENPKYSIRNSVSRYFSEQCEKASRDKETDTMQNIRKSPTDKSPDVSRDSSPVSLKHMKLPSPVNKSPQPYRKLPGDFATTTDVDMSRSTTPEFFCYETEKLATTVSLKPKPLKDSKGYSRSPPPASVRSESRSSKSSDTFISTKNVTIDTSRSNSPALSRGMTYSGRASPGLSSSEKDKSAMTISSERKYTKDLHKHSKSLLSTNVHPRSKSPRNSDVFASTRDSGIIGNNRKINHNSSRLQKDTYNRKSPEFFCYETEKSATTVSLKPKPLKESRNCSRSPQFTIRCESRSSKNPDVFTLTKDKKQTGSADRINRLSLSPEKDALSRNGTPEFFCYETEKSAMSVSLKPKTAKIPFYERSKSPRFSEAYFKGRSSKSPEQSVKDPKGTVRRGSGNVLRSTRLIRDIIKHQKNKNSSSWKDTDVPKNRGDNKDVEWKHRSKYDTAFRVTREVGKRATTPSDRRCKLSTVETSPKSSASAEMNSETQEITMTDQCVKGRRLQQELRSTYSKLSKKSAGSRKPEKGFTYSVNKLSKNRRSLLDSDIFHLSKKDQRTAGSPGKGTSLKRMSPSPTGELVVAMEDTLEEENPSGSLRSGGQTLSRQAPALGSIELVRKVMKSGPRVSDKTLKTQEVEDGPPGEIQRWGSNSVVSGTSEVNDEGSSSKNYERTDSVESALRRFDSIDTEAGAESVQSTLERGKESATEKRQTLEESGIGGPSNDSRAISLKALDGSDVNLPRAPGNKPSGMRLKKILTKEASDVEASGRGKAAKREEIRRQERIARVGNSVEIVEIAARSRPLVCRLFQDVNSVDDIETGSPKSKRGNSSGRIPFGKIRSNKDGLADSVKNNAKFLMSSGDGTSIKRANKREPGEASTGTSDSDRSLSVKQLRSIEDIRKSIGSSSSDCRATRGSKSAIAGNAFKGSNAARLQSRVSSDIACVRNENELSLAKRPKNHSARDNALKDSGRFVKSATRFSRVVKSPSLDSTKLTETGSRIRRSVLSPPSKSPDTVTRRPSTDLKSSDIKSIKRTTPTKETEPIGNKKTVTTTTTAIRKSTDVVDGAVFENGLHLQDQTAETKYDNDSQTAKKFSDIDNDEQATLKENNGPLSRKPLLRKSSTEKQTPSTQTGRPPSSVSSTSNGSFMQASTSGPKLKMTSKAKTSSFATNSSRTSASSKIGSACTPDLLVPCKICGRRFAQDRVVLHEQICTKTGQKKRKLFDSVMYRVKGTELEKFVLKKGSSKKQPEKSSEVKSNWRRKHEDFINAIRSAKQVQAHLAAGGKLSDLPPPPASDTSDYIQCPHCGRKFNKAAAERHIPKCEHMLHNKPIHSRAPKPKR
ncbi:uncharacterized protein LOC116426686 isoform X3 [Nomia melanderi]|uniref:uncharacterized protein LOC116426686 isoform X3 n=1 Tax=Nomia melanderi TaxID=2448451 RepID=UPI0013044258|nr:uncharacterized protein LOC116426686 isoform X1 [Nomia melanderi]